MIWGGLQVGDWVKANRTVPVTFTDSITESGVRPGTMGVVTDTAGSRVQVAFEGGFGTVDAWVPTRHLRVVGRGRGVGSFRSHARRIAVARAALSLFLAWPVLKFLAIYGWTHHGFSGVTSAFALAVIDSIGDWLAMLVQQPVKTVVYLIFLGILGRLAWR